MVGPALGLEPLEAIDIVCKRVIRLGLFDLFLLLFLPECSPLGQWCPRPHELVLNIDCLIISLQINEVILSLNQLYVCHPGRSSPLKRRGEVEAESAAEEDEALLQLVLLLLGDRNRLVYRAVEYLLHQGLIQLILELLDPAEHGLGFPDSELLELLAFDIQTVNRAVAFVDDYPLLILHQAPGIFIGLYDLGIRSWGRSTAMAGRHSWISFLLNLLTLTVEQI